MQSIGDRFSLVVAAQRARHGRRFRFCCFIGGVILALLVTTKWFVLRPGLAILLFGQAGTALALLVRMRQLAITLRDVEADMLPWDAMLTWFDSEMRFVTRLPLFESVVQAAGFLVLGYAFGTAIGNFWIALTIGILYPVSMYFGLTRKQRRSAIRQLAQDRDRFAHDRSPKAF